MYNIVLDLCMVFLLFLSYSSLGYLIEVTAMTINTGKIVWNRGFLLGPYLPVFGVGAIIMVLTLEKYQNDLVALFVMGALVCTIVEYITSLIMEKLFKIRWWDYSDMKFNVNGRVCLLNSLLFGVGGIIIVKLVNPFLVGVLNGFPNLLLLILGIVLMLIFTSDLILSIITLVKLKLNSSMFIKKDATEEVKLMIKDALKVNTVFINRMLKAFPNIKKFNAKEIKDFGEFIEALRKERKKEKKLKKTKQLK